ncbi:MAG TPA: ATP-binding protein [Bryobacteraceae bacterium]|nr:ATP-binding protein [Bryobacteraceae bacterium]
MKSLLKKRLQLQLLFVLLAAVLVAALSVLLISDAIRGAESVVLNDASKALTTAVSELDRQYRDRVGADTAWRALPVPAQDTSLRGVSQAVLRSYPGIEGGYQIATHFLGYSFPTHDTGGKKIDVPTAELDDILATISEAGASGVAHRILRGRHDLVVIEAKADRQSGIASWAMKRLAAQSDPGTHRHEILLAALVLAALISIAGTLTTGIVLQRGILQIKSGLAALESDFSHRLPERNDEIGEINHSINRMAAARQKLESDLRREDRLRTIGRLAAGIAHEIRNPLNSIRLSIRYLERRLGPGQVRTEDLHPVVEEVDRLSGLLTNLLIFQKTSQPALRQQPVPPVLERCVRLIEPQADARQIKIHTDLGSRDVEACFEAEQLTQVVTNIMLNAAEVVEQHGTIDLHLEQRDGKAYIQVHDSGPGLTAEQTEHLFEAFYTTKPQGTGLGLAVSRELMIGMGGSLRYVNGRSSLAASGLGATFEIELTGAANPAEMPAADDYAKCHDSDR